MIVKLLTEHHLEFLRVKGGCRGSSESTHVKMSNCWKSHAAAHMQIQLHQHPSNIINGHNKPLTIRVLLYLGADFYVDIKPYTIPPLLFE